MTPIPPALPELGPLLGDLAAPDSPASRDGELEPVRQELISALFDQAGRGRELLAAGDEAAARAALGRDVWIAVWEKAVAGAASAVLAGIERRLHDAAAISRMPGKRAAGLLPTPEERGMLTARLASAGIGLEEVTRELGNPAIAWPDAIRRTAGELTGAWDRLRALARKEHEFWDRRTAIAREWRRPWRPLIVLGLGLLAGAIWLGLVLGGYLPAPAFLRPLAEWYWSLEWP